MCNSLLTHTDISANTAHHDFPATVKAIENHLGEIISFIHSVDTRLKNLEQNLLPASSSSNSKVLAQTSLDAGKTTDMRSLTRAATKTKLSAFTTFKPKQVSSLFQTVPPSFNNLGSALAAPVLSNSAPSTSVTVEATLPSTTTEPSAIGAMTTTKAMLTSLSEPRQRKQAVVESDSDSNASATGTEREIESGEDVSPLSTLKAPSAPSTVDPKSAIAKAASTTTVPSGIAPLTRSASRKANSTSLTNPHRRKQAVVESDSDSSARANGAESDDGSSEHIALMEGDVEEELSQHVKKRKHGGGHQEGGKRARKSS